MKTIFIVAMICASSIVMAQVPQAFSYQGIAMNAEGLTIINNNIGIKISIGAFENDELFYSETHFATTSEIGLFNINIGEGEPQSGVFETINWGVR